ncbi:7,8-didemethyl-8-hydroxy-5-deazariboflavin synthase CofG [Microbacterium sp. LRZ72]|uniref:7,8-didemethyl-8-hydroxy-5-deazariboflavin synthase CofG n=1 Tax=Microbacterium sp. LRZ72 TaxID=2942481 RepID=UPI0029A8B279|nr:7,8-didemethyl-8-hydroxy-5-deazariboflavin synthase CofG [Microbacterium sp. LRZ72]MDX2376423.1 7,8-didemethyl-8-hydroxy-5-deazariboflavin synthase CofG [Microbacterium sp. LRZ72]
MESVATAHLTHAEAESLLAARGTELETLFSRAGEMRDEGLARADRPGVMTYSRKVFLPLTTLCRDRCHYCVFVDTPAQLQRAHKPLFMTAEQVLTVARRGAALGCREALFTLGDRPEDRWPQARSWLDEHGYASTLDYVGAMARLVRDETGLLPHLNPGVMTLDEIRTLRPAAPSMGMMLETTSRRLYEEPGQVHHGSPDKDPAVRLQVIEDAGVARVPFTTGILVGIGETLRDRAESLFAIRDAHARHGHIQEVIVQNFRAKPRTAMRGAPDAELLDYATTIAVARLVLGPDMRIQVPPNLSDPGELGLLVRAGADDWGGVSPLTADHVNPERPWPQLDDLGARTAELGFDLRERLTAHPEYVRDAQRWIDGECLPATLALADPATGLASREQARVAQAPAGTGAATGASAEREPSGRLLDRAATDPSSLEDVEWVQLLTARDTALDALTETADQLRRFTVGEAVSIVVNRNVSSSLYRASRTAEADTYDAAALADIARDAVELGATELCVQGNTAATEAPEAYFEIARTIRTAAPGIHLHAFRPADIDDLARRTGLGLEGALDAMAHAGVDTVPGTGVKVLDDRIRRLVAPDDIPVDRWLEVVTAAHRAGFRSTSVLFYGHAETAEERIAHLRRLIAIQSETGGFTEFVPIPLPGHGAALVPGRSAADEHRAMFAVSRLMLSGSIAHIQVPWTRLDHPTVRALLRAGADDLGGTLLDGRVLPRAGVEHGHELTLDRAERLAGALSRPLRRRATDYRDAPAGAR